MWYSSSSPPTPKTGGDQSRGGFVPPLIPLPPCVLQNGVYTYSCLFILLGGDDCPHVVAAWKFKGCHHLWADAFLGETEGEVGAVIAQDQLPWTEFQRRTSRVENTTFTQI